MTPPRADAPFLRVPLVPLIGVRSSYDPDGETGGPWSERKDLGGTRTGWGTPGLYKALTTAQRAVLEAGGTMGVTECYRSFATSQKAHDKWKRGDRKHYACPGGASVHNAGQAIDIDAYHLGGLDLADVWDIVVPLGFTPIISEPKMVSECWHFDFRGEWYDFHRWAKKNARRNAYAQLARCMTLDVGAWDGKASGWSSKRIEVAYIQAQLHRIGVHVVGKVDGLPGPATRRAVSAAFPEQAPCQDIESPEGRREAAAGLNAMPTPVARR